MKLKPGYELEKLIPEGHGFNPRGVHVMLSCYFAFKCAMLARAYSFDESGNLSYIWSLRRFSPIVVGSIFLSLGIWVVGLWHFGWLFRRHADQARDKVRALLQDPSFRPQPVTIRPISLVGKFGCWLEGVEYRRAVSSDGKRKKVLCAWSPNDEFEAFLFPTHNLTAWTFPTRTRLPVAIPKEAFDSVRE